MADDHPGADDPETERSSALAAGLTAEMAREEAATPAEPATSPAPDTTLLDMGALPLFPLQPPRTSRELLTDHVTAMVCCAAMDTAGATPGLDWLDGPTLLINGARAADLTPASSASSRKATRAPCAPGSWSRGYAPRSPYAWSDDRTRSGRTGRTNPGQTVVDAIRGRSPRFHFRPIRNE